MDNLDSQDHNKSNNSNKCRPPMACIIQYYETWKKPSIIRLVIKHKKTNLSVFFYFFILSLFKLNLSFSCFGHYDSVPVISIKLKRTTFSWSTVPPNPHRTNRNIAHVYGKGTTFFTCTCPSPYSTVVSLLGICDNLPPLKP